MNCFVHLTHCTSFDRASTAHGQRPASITRLALPALLALLTLGSASAATLTVTSTADSGAGSLRQSIADAASGDTLVFDLPFPATITLGSTLALAKDLTIRGPGAAALTVSGNNATRIFSVSSANVEVSGLKLAYGVVSASTGGGAFLLEGTTTLTVDRCEVTACGAQGVAATRGGAFYALADSTLHLRRSYVHANSAAASLSFSEGGAIYTEGHLTIIDSTLSNNMAVRGSALMYRGAAGKAVALVGCTVSGNTAARYGAVMHQSPGTMSLVNCTITGNSAIDTTGSYEAGLSGYGGGTITLQNSIIAANLTANGLGDTDIFFDTAGTYSGGTPFTCTSLGHNFIGSEGSRTYVWVTGDEVGTEVAKLVPPLGALADNGGWVPTHAVALTAGLTLIDAGTGSGAPFVDGRGYLRASFPDKGATEYDGTRPTAAPATDLAPTSFTARWNAMPGATGYILDVATDAAFTKPLPGFSDLVVNSPTTLDAAVTGLTPGTTYYYRVRGYADESQTFYTATQSASWPMTYATWAAAHFTPTELADPTIAGTNADPDSAGLSNLLRYALGLAARGPVVSPVATTVSGSTITIGFPIRPSTADLLYTVQSSTDLAAWTDVESFPSTTAQQQVSLAVAAPIDASRFFVRLKVVATP